jgi:hypothetical protein
MTTAKWKIENALADIEATGWPEPDNTERYQHLSTLNRMQYYLGKWYLRVVVLYQTTEKKRVTICERFTVNDNQFYLVGGDNQCVYLASTDDLDSCRLALTQFFSQRACELDLGGHLGK